jgi:hypothetical protein
MGAKPIIAVNPMQNGKDSKVPNAEFFKGKRYPVEQFNSHIQHNLLQGCCWVRPKGLLKKASMVRAALVCMATNALEALLVDELDVKCTNKY